MTNSNLTQSQLLIWMGQVLNPNAPLYNMALAFELNGNIDEQHFQAAFQKLIDSSDALRTVFRTENDTPQQEVLTTINHTVEVIDATSQSEEEIKKRLSNRAQRNFDVSKPLFDAVLLKQSDAKYIWYFNQHHLITDGWSVTVLYKKMGELYGQSINGKLSEATSLPPYEKYRNYEQKSRAKQQAQADSENYWKEQLSCLPATPKLYGYADAGKGSDSQRLSVSLGKERTDRLRALTQETDLRAWTEHLSLFNIFATLLMAYIYRVSGQQKLSIGTPSHNRPTPDFKNTAGLFVELFPLIANIEKGESFISLFRKVQGEANEFLKYAQSGAAFPELSRGFNVVLNYINATFSDFNGIAMQSDWVHPNHADTAHVLRLQVHDFDGSGIITLHFDVNTTVFPEKVKEQMSTHFIQLVDAFIENRAMSIAKPSLLGSNELVEHLPEKTVKPLECKSVIQLFEEQVSQIGSNTAIDYQGETWSFEEVNQKANQLANYIIEKGVTPQSRVAIYLKRSPDLVIAVLAILKAGATYIPIDTNYSGVRTTDIIEDGEVTAIIITSNLQGVISNFETNTIVVDKEWDTIHQQNNTNLNQELTSESLVYVMYTSGSTGKPKGVMITHQSLSHYLQYAATNYRADNKFIVPLFSAVGFDLTVTSLFLPLVTGGTSVIYTEPNEEPDLAIFDVLKDNKANFIKLTPSHLSLLTENDYSNLNIEVMIVGGEDFKYGLAKSIQTKFGENIRIYNEYGPTEATVGCIVGQFNANDAIKPSVAIGKSIPNTAAYILDDYLNPVPQGVVGELYIGGIGLAKGYWKQENLTKEKFISNPFLEGGQLYRSGDLVRLDENGNIDYLGRVDEQVKISGRRIELGEIETAINKLEGIENSVVELRTRAKAVAIHDVKNCSKCGLPSNYPKIKFDENEVCSLCTSFENYQNSVRKYFQNMDVLKAHFDAIPNREERQYDCISLLSGGKDSTYALAKLVEMGLRVLAYTFDNGYISEQAIANTKRVTQALGVDHIIGSTPAINEIFVDSLKTHYNVCDGCFKTIYTLSTQVALEKNIPFIVTGLSRGQFFETRLTEELFTSDDMEDIAKIDRIILDVRKAYHKIDDAVKQLLDVSIFEDDTVFEKVQFLDFYRYTDVSLDQMLNYMEEKLKKFQAGIFVHKKERGYSNYAFPYSWDVRLGHKTRDASLDEINEEIDEPEVHRILDEIGYTAAQEANPEMQQLVAYYVGNDAVEDRTIREHLETQLPDYMIPVQFIRLDEMPLSENGKIDKTALPLPETIRAVTEVGYVAPRTDIEEILADIWSEVLQIDQIGVYDKFLELGGSSLAAIRIISRANEAFELELPLNLAFNKPTIAAFAEYVRETIVDLLAKMDAE